MLINALFHQAPARWFALVGWALAIFLCLCPIYGLYSTYHSEDELSHLATIIYYTFSRLSWSVGVGWVILACFAGYGGTLNFVACRRFSYLQSYILKFPSTGQLGGRKISIARNVLWIVITWMFEYHVALKRNSHFLR